MGRLIVLTAAVLCFAGLQAVRAQMPSNTPCTDQVALGVVENDPEVIEFCSSTEEGRENGCFYKVRPAVKGDTPGLQWNVLASIIHSIDDKGKPVFKPGEDLMVGVAQDCKISNTLASNSRCKARPGYSCRKL